MRILSRRPRIRLMFIIFLVLLIGFILTGIKLIKSYPLSGTKDWLDILSAIGQASEVSAVLALFFLAFQLFRYEQELRRKRIPIIEIVGTPELVDTDSANSAHGCCLCEESVDDLPPKDSVTHAHYRELWHSFNNNQERVFVRIEVRNKQHEVDGSAKELQLFIRLKYYKSMEAKRETIAKEFWCPHQSNLSVPSGEDHRFLGIRCGKINQSNTDYIEGKILNYKCKNLRGDTFMGSKMDFQTIAMPRQRLVSRQIPE